MHEHLHRHRRHQLRNFPTAFNLRIQFGIVGRLQSSLFVHLAAESPGTATYYMYGKEIMPPRQSRQVLQGHQGSSCGFKRKRCVEGDVAMPVLPSIVDFAHRNEEDRSYRLHRWLWDLHLPSKLQADHRGREGSPLPHCRCRHAIHREASCNGDCQERRLLTTSPPSPRPPWLLLGVSSSDPGGPPPRPGIP